MSMNDLLSDSLTRIRNAQMASKKEVLVRKSKLVSNVLTLLQEEGYIESFSDAVDKNIPCIKVDLAYYDGHPVIRLLKRISKPGKRVYSSIRHLSKSYNGLGIKVLSTSQGVMSDRLAREKGIGGEVLCEIF